MIVPPRNHPLTLSEPEVSAWVMDGAFRGWAEGNAFDRMRQLSATLSVALYHHLVSGVRTKMHDVV